MSNFVESAIFNDFIKYLEQQGFTSRKTVKPIDNADVYYYFRPNLEKQLKSPSVVTVHHDLDENDAVLSFENFLPRYREAKLIVCLNSKQQGFLKKYGINNTIVIPHGFNSKIFRLCKKKQNKKKVLGFVSSFYPRLVKGEDYLIQMASNLNPNDFSFVLVGKKRKLLGLELQEIGFDCVIYENLPYNFFGELYKGIDYLLITSKFEGGPANLPEALSTNTPVFSTLVGMVNDYIDEPLVTVLSGDVKADSKKIMSFEEKSFLRTKRSANLLDWEDVSKRYYAAFISVKIKNQKFLLKSWLLGHYSNFYFKYKTLYFKKRLKSFYCGIKDSLRFIYNSRYLKK
jgi:glycosyltransferase involved in cell wall biosynthesis